MSTNKDGVIQRDMGDNVMANNDTVPLLQRNEHHRRPSSDPFLYIVVAVSLLAPISAGYTIGYSSPAIPQLKNDTILDDNSASWFGSLLNVGAIFGGPVAGFLIGSIGRKATLMACAVPFAVGWALIASVPYVWGLYLGRVLTGFATGMTTLACPIYIAEMASPDNRGFLGSSFQLFITLGILLVYTLGFGFFRKKPISSGDVEETGRNCENWHICSTTHIHDKETNSLPPSD